MKLRYAVVGAGAIGGYYGGKLAMSGCDVHFLYHSDFEWVKNHGLRVDSVKGDFFLRTINAYGDPADMPSCDVALVCLKSTQNHLLPELLKPILHEGTMVVLIQNGLGLEQQLARSLTSQPIAGGMAFICASRVSAGYIRHMDYGSLTVGAYQNVEGGILKQVREDFSRADVKMYIADDLNLARWKKLVWNIPYNGLTVALETTTDKLMAQPDSRNLVRELMAETVLGAKACGADIPSSFIESMLQSTDEMTPYAPSMKLDWDNRRRMEIDAIYTNPIKSAKENGFYMKKVEMLEQQLRFKEWTVEKKQ